MEIEVEIANCRNYILKLLEIGDEIQYKFLYYFYSAAYLNSKNLPFEHVVADMVKRGNCTINFETSLIKRIK